MASPEGYLTGFIVLVWIFLSIRSDVFLTERNIGVLLSQVALIAITGFGMTLLMIAREVDLSVGSMQAFVGVLAMQSLNRWPYLLVGIAVAILLGVIVGLINSGLTLKLGITSFIVTLAMMQILRGAAYTSTSAAVQNDHKLSSFKRVFNGAIIEDPVRIPWPVAIMAFFFVLFSLIVAKTTFGRSLYALGSNPEAAALSGIHVWRLKTICFVITSALAGLSAFMLIARMNSGQNNAGFGFELQVIGAVLLGGASLAGGKGTILGTFLATLLLGSLNNGITLMGYNPNWQWAVTGIIILIAVLLDSVRRRVTQES
ncbi:MAG: ABC transporter permease [Thermomicrobiales bacterium]|nr:ABC transporter permease [Thermomicrobiales bacterium]